MKNIKLPHPVFLLIPVILILLLGSSCEMPATNFDEQETAIYYQRKEKIQPPSPDSTVKVMTWNIRYGFARGPWFGDACGYKVIYTKDEILTNLQMIADRINSVKPDILLLQEAEINSTRSAYVNELKWLMDHTYFNYAAYGAQWKAQYVPSDGLGRIEESNAILSRWPISNAKRIQLELRSDQSAVVRYFYERYCMVKAVITIPGFKPFYAVNIHAAAFATDDTKKKNLEEFKLLLDDLSSEGMMFVAGGDLNSIPPQSDSTDFCFEDMCNGESFHQKGDDPYHKEGSDYSPEKEWLIPFYNDYRCAVELDEYLQNQELFFTHTTRPEHTWDRTLDYLFTNNNWKSGSTIVYQSFTRESDHAPVSSELLLIKI